MKKRLIYALSAVLLAGSALTVGKLLNNKFENSVQPAEAAETTSAIIENVGGTDYRVIYYYVDSNWEYGQGFGTNGNGGLGDHDFSHGYTYISSGISQTVQFGKTDSSGNSLNEVISDFTAKIYLPTNVSSIEFKSRYNSSNASHTTGSFDLTGSEECSSRQAYVVTTNFYDDPSIDPKGVWETYDEFMSRFKYIYFTVTSSWHGGESALNTDYVWVSHKASDGATVGRDFPITDNMIGTFESGKHYAKLLVSSASGATIQFENGHKASMPPAYSETWTIPTQDDALAYIHTNNGATNQGVHTATYLEAGDYVFFSPNSGWKNDDAIFRIVTCDIFEQDIEAYKKMTLLTSDKFGGLFTTNDVYYYQVTKSCSIVKFMRWNPNYPTETDTDTSHQWNYSNACYTNVSGAYWVDMTAYSGEYNGWSTDDTNINWTTIPYLYSLTSDQSATDDTARVFFNNSDTPWKDEGSCALRAEGGSATTKYWPKTVYFLSWFEDKDDSGTGVWYGYADVPTDINKINFSLFNGASYSPTLWNNSTSSDFEVVSDSFAKIYHAYGSTKEATAIAAGGAKGDTARTELIRNVLAAINTCSDNVFNGYKAYTNLNTYVFSHKTEYSTTQTAVTRNDEEAFAISYILECLAYRDVSGVTPSVTPKIIFFNEGSNGMVETIIIISAITLVAAATFFIIRRKRSI